MKFIVLYFMITNVFASFLSIDNNFYRDDDTYFTSSPLLFQTTNGGIHEIYVRDFDTFLDNQENLKDFSFWAEQTTSWYCIELITSQYKHADLVESDSNIINKCNVLSARLTTADNFLIIKEFITFVQKTSHDFQYVHISKWFEFIKEQKDFQIEKYLHTGHEDHKEIPSISSSVQTSFIVSSILTNVESICLTPSTPSKVKFVRKCCAYKMGKK